MEKTIKKAEEKPEESLKLRTCVLRTYAALMYLKRDKLKKHSCKIGTDLISLITTIVTKVQKVLLQPTRLTAL
jgi:hypothetical protein